MIRNKLKSIRHQHEMNQKEFAEFLGFRPEQISRWEKQNWQPSIENVIKICIKLKIPVQELFDIVEDPED